MNPTSTFSSWAKDFSGCDGGDIGWRENRSIWFCGIEWGGGHDANVKMLTEIFSEDLSKPYPGYEEWQHNLAYIYNWQAMKLLSAIHGGKVADYKKFAEERKPFTAGGSGFFKMNLYPIAFRNTSHKHWVGAFAEATGFPNKSDYLEWTQTHRFPVMRQWAESHVPKLIVCTGITYESEFLRAFGDEHMPVVRERHDDRDLIYARNKNGTLIVIIPFMVNRYGLTKNVLIQHFGERIKSLLEVETIAA